MPISSDNEPALRAPGPTIFLTIVSLNDVLYLLLMLLILCPAKSRRGGFSPHGIGGYAHATTTLTQGASAPGWVFLLWSLGGSLA